MLPAGEDDRTTAGGTWFVSASPRTKMFVFLSPARQCALTFDSVSIGLSSC
jgi:hypothetical protein